jgi:hypothetical protein
MALIRANMRAIDQLNTRQSMPKCLLPSHSKNDQLQTVITALLIKSLFVFSVSVFLSQKGVVTLFMLRF